jgi:hypothetical protein
MTRRPAYARKLAATLAAGQEPFHGIAVFLDQRPPEKPLCAPLACFSDTEPDQLDWSLCRGRDVIVPHADRCNPDRLERLLDAIKDTGPRRLQAWHSTGEWVRYVVTDDGRAAA